MHERFAELKNRLAEIHDLRRAQEILFWDQTVMMPPGGGGRPRRPADDARPVAHERFIARRDRRAARRARAATRRASTTTPTRRA